MYETLRRLYQGGNLDSYIVPSDEGPHRKCYGVNERGRAALERSAQIWSTFTAALARLLNGRNAPDGR